MLMIGVFEWIGSERGIAWRCADSRSLADFLSFGPTGATPEHSTLSKTRQCLDVETHDEVFDWVLSVLAKHGAITGQVLGIDRSTLQANATMRSIVARADGLRYEDFLGDLAQSSGFATPTREDCAWLDKTRRRRAATTTGHTRTIPTRESRG